MIFNKILRNFFVFQFICFGTILASSIYNEQNYYAKTSLYLNTELDLSFVTNRLNDGWVKDTDNYLYANNGKSDSTPWDNNFNAKLGVETYLNYNKNIKAMLAFDIYGSEYNSLWRPINDQNKKFNEKAEYISLKKAEINIKDYFYHLRYFKGIPHYHWGYEGDLFGFYKEQFETQKYLDISERTIPEGIELDYSFNTIGDLKVIYGEPIWGSQNSVYLKHNYEIGNFSNYFVYKNEKLPWEVKDGKDKYKEAYSLNTKIQNFLPFNLSLGVMYQPFRVGSEYDYIEYTSYGDGVFGSNYIKKIDKAKNSDGLGYAIKLDYKNFYWLDYVSFESKYLDILAGNKQEYKLSLDKILNRNFIVDFKLNYRKPIMEANPLIYEGTISNLGQPYMTPRGEHSPFWVDNDNREKISGDISLSYFHSTMNPTLLYNYDIGNVEYWNLNDKDNVDFAVAFNYNIQKFKGATDSQYYFDKDGNVVWETIGTSGLFEPKEPMSIYTLFIKGRYQTLFNYNFYIQTGQSIATGAYPYIKNQFDSITDFLDMNFNLNFNKYSLNLKYGKNNWGYEDWHRAFGITYDNLYKLEISRDFGIFGRFGISYLNVFQNKYKTEIIEIPSFEEIMVKWVYNFERIYILKNYEYEKNIEKNKLVDIEGKDSLDDKIIISSKSNILTSNNDGMNDIIRFAIYWKSSKNINNWEISIYEYNGDNLVYKKEGYGDLPSFFEWTGKTELVPELKEGQYYIKIIAKDTKNNIIDSNKYNFDLYFNESIINDDILLELTKNSDININETYKSIIFTYKLDNIYNVSNGKINYKNIDDILIILKKNEVNKIKINIYVNFGRSIIDDQNISNKIGLEISKYLVQKGIDYKLIESLGISIKDKNKLTNINENIINIECSYNV
ncbi:MAG: hypothetical protein LBF97_08350 [Elusimicrobiota bacterium]|jgi:hypothetical protein|nr:hypothetical protein [Elusimicrobiota bacterium]